MPILRGDFLRFSSFYLFRWSFIRVISLDTSKCCFAFLLTDKQESGLYISLLVGGKHLSYLYCDALTLTKRDIYKKSDHRKQILGISNRFRNNYKNIKIGWFLKVKLVFTLHIESVYYADVSHHAEEAVRQDNWFVDLRYDWLVDFKGYKVTGVERTPSVRSAPQSPYIRVTSFEAP